MDTTFENPTEELIHMISVEVTSIQRKLEEINGQIEQYNSMVNREETRNADLATDLRAIQDNIDSVPREDIQEKYDEAMDARFRLATMRGQLEQYKIMQERLQEERKILNAVLTKIQGGISMGSGGDEEEADPMAPGTPLNIVRIVQAQEEERQRLARQMHDGPAQSLTNFVLQAEICQRLFDKNPQGAEEELGNLKTAASVTFQKVRDFIFDLRPMMLDDLGLVPTVRRYVESFREKNDIEVNLDITGDEIRAETYQEVMLFRAIQELMAFARDNADANKVSVKMDITNNLAKAVIEDNGRGFDTEAVFSGEHHSEDPRVQGLITLREKFTLIRGDIAIDSDEDSGTQVRIEMPVVERR